MKNFIMDGAIISRIIACFFFFVKKKFVLVVQYSLCKQMLPLFFFFFFMNVNRYCLGTLFPFYKYVLLLMIRLHWTRRASYDTINSNRFYIDMTL